MRRRLKRVGGEGLPGNAGVVCGGATYGAEASEIVDFFTGGGSGESGSEIRGLVDDDEELGIADGGVEVIGDEAGDEGDALEDVLAIGAGELGEMDMGIVDFELETFAEEAFDDIDDRGIAEVIGTGFEGEAEEGDILEIEIEDLAKDQIFLGLVTELDGGEEGSLEVEIVGDGLEGAEIFGEAGATVSEAWFEVSAGEIEFGILAKDFHELMGIDFEFFVDIPDLVGESDFEGVEAIAGILHEFGDLWGGDDEGGEDGGIEVAEEIGGPGAIGADESESGVGEVMDRRAFAKEFGIGDDGEIDIGGEVGEIGDDLGDEGIGAWEDGGAEGDEMASGRFGEESGGDLGGDRVDSGEVEVAIGGGGGADADERDIGLGDGLGDG